MTAAAEHEGAGPPAGVGQAGDPAAAGAADAEAGVAARMAAFRAVRHVHQRQTWSQAAVAAQLERADDLDARDRAFAANLAYETLRWQGTLDWVLAQVSSRRPERIDDAVLDALRLGAWQLLYGDAPDHAAVATTVEVARRGVGEHVTGFVNGVLRGLVRQRDRLVWPASDSDDGLALATGNPVWVAGAARQRFGAQARALLDASNVAPGVTLRASGDPDALAETLRGSGLDPVPGRYAPEALRVPGADPSRLAVVADGRAVVQDEASMLVARAALADVLDDAGRAPAGTLAVELAAAPGGKATHLAQLGAGVVACDLRHGRTRQIAALASRLGLDERVLAVTADGAAPPLAPASADVVLVDAPCTGLGVTRRRPELRWRQSEDDPDRLAALQLRLLRAAAGIVRPGGRICYSVCTWTSAETVAVARGFLATVGERFALADATDGLGGAGTVCDGGLGVQLRPDTDGTDGMYVCGFRRRD